VGDKNKSTAHWHISSIWLASAYKKGIKAKRFKAALDSDYAEKVMLTVF